MEVAFFDRTARGRLIVTGRDRADLVDRLATNRVIGVDEGHGVATCFCTAKGRMIDWTVVLNRGSDLLLLSANPERLSGHIQQFTITEDVTVRNYMAIEIVVCGPGAAALLGVQLEPWAFADTILGEVKVQVVRIEPLMGEAYAVLAPDAVALRRLLEDSGTRLGADAVDAVRVRQGIPAFPNEINERHNPWEAGLDAAISLTKGCYIGQEVIARLNTYDKVQRKLAALRLERPMEGGEEVTREGEGVGVLTTVVGGAALAYVDVELTTPGTALDGAEVVGFE
ncbi:MAG: CAF17-like 4Fe-4S cluster assembly/insertion protein YgfZ [Planctomycetota bacterium]|jgi:folate-binding protein YgfZ